MKIVNPPAVDFETDILLKNAASFLITGSGGGCGGADNRTAFCGSRGKAALFIAKLRGGGGGTDDSLTDREYVSFKESATGPHGGGGGGCW